MELTSLETVKFLIKKHKIRPSRQTGQNFLICRDVLETMMARAEIQSGEEVLEIGPGFGTLTSELLEAGASVTAVELDRNLAGSLVSMEGLYKKFILIRGDIVKKWPAINKSFGNLEYKLVANLPYSLTSLIFRLFLGEAPRPKKIVVLIQKEVAQRIVAKPGEMSMLSIAVQFYGLPKIVSEVKSDCFWPAPEVDSAILEVNKISTDSNEYQKKLGKVNEEKLFQIAKIGFSSRRKQLHNNLANGLHKKNDEIKIFLSSLGIDPAIRAQDLSIDQWVQITKNV